MKQTSFSLVEMLIVMAIMAILSSFLSPSLSRIMSRAETIKCATTLKWYMAAAQIYMNDHNDEWALHKIVHRETFQTGLTHHVNLMKEGYVANEFSENAYLDNGGFKTTSEAHKKVECPSNPRAEDFFGSWNAYGININASLQENGNMNHYSQTVITTENVNIYNDPADNLGLRVEYILLSTAMVTQPQRLIILGDSINPKNGFLQTATIKPLATSNSLGLYHDLKSNIMFLDGHLETLDPIDIYSEHGWARFAAPPDVVISF